MKNEIETDLELNDSIYNNFINENDRNLNLKIPINYVRLLYWNKLPQSIKQILYERFLSMNSKSKTSYAKVINISQQLELAESRKIDLLPLIEFLRIFDIDEKLLCNIKFPLSENEYSVLHGTEKSTNDSQENIILSCLKTKLEQIQYYERLTNIQKQKTDLLFNYLICNENQNIYEEENLDLIIVFGCRKRGIEYRMRKVVELIQKNPKTFIFITGGYDNNIEDGNVPVSESAIMLYYLNNILKVNNRNIIIDENAKNTEENVIHSILQIKNIYILRERPINVAIITSPYHMRRSMLIFQYWISAIPKMIRHFICAPSDSIYNKNNWLGLCDNNLDTLKSDGLRLYIGEYFKLIGGRVTGEF